MMSCPSSLRTLFISKIISSCLSWCSIVSKEVTKSTELSGRGIAVQSPNKNFRFSI